MNMNPKHWLIVAAMVVGAGVGTATAAPLFQTQNPDYSKNKTYQQGMRDGQGDQVTKKDHSKKRHYKKDDDQKAYEAGYQKARGN
jgi:NADH:ubiquinone oxidoreductase subunit 3 (subunit A)